MNSNSQQDPQDVTSTQPTIEQLMEQLTAAQAELEQLKARKANGKLKREFVYTPFQATKDMNEKRRALGLSEVNSPMIYIYARKGYFVIGEAEDGRKVVDKASFDAWCDAHNAEQLRKLGVAIKQQQTATAEPAKTEETATN